MTTPESRFSALVDAFANDPAVTPPQAGGRRKFGSEALRTGGRIFAMLTRGQLAVKLPRPRVEQLTATGEGVPLDTGNGRVMREWLALDPASSLEWLPLAHEARDFVAGQG